MTALKKYQRLESTGLWRAAPDDRLREVVVAFGEASLVISDSRSGTVMAHWSLPAVERIGRAEAGTGARGALFAPGREALETLEIDDETMIEAIGTVRRVIANRQRGRIGRARRLIPATIALAAVLAGALWLPGALIRYTASVLPEVKRGELAAAVLADIVADGARPCTAPLGRRALGRLAVRVLGPTGRALVLPSGPQPSAHLPDGRVLLARALVEDADGPEAAAGFLLAEHLAARNSDPVLPLLRHAGVLASFRLLTTGDIPKGALEGYGAKVFARGPARPEATDLLTAMRAAGVAAGPYARVLDPSGATVGDLIAADPFRDTPPPVLLTDGEWVSLQSICQG